MRKMGEMNVQWKSEEQGRFWQGLLISWLILWKRVADWLILLPNLSSGLWLGAKTKSWVLIGRNELIFLGTQIMRHYTFSTRSGFRMGFSQGSATGRVFSTRPGNPGSELGSVSRNFSGPGSGFRIFKSGFRAGFRGLEPGPCRSLDFPGIWNIIYPLTGFLGFWGWDFLVIVRVFEIFMQWGFFAFIFSF